MRSLLIIIGCTVAFLCVAGSNYKTGVEAYNKGEYQNAYNLLLPEAEEGNTNAQFRIGYLLVNGLGIDKNTKQGITWIRKSAESGDFVAQSHLGKTYFEGEAVKRNLIEAYAWTEASSKKYEHKITFAQLSLIKSAMNQEQLNEAKILAKKYIENYVKPFSK